MNAVLDTVVLAFASVGLFALGHWIFRSGWRIHWKVISVLFVISLCWTMINGPIKGHFGADHGALTGIFATFGIVMAVTMAFRRFAHGWQPWAITGAALVLLILMWFPRFDASHASVAAQAQHSGRTPVQISQPNSSTSAQSGHSQQIDCKALSYEGRQAVGCP